MEEKNCEEITLENYVELGYPEYLSPFLSENGRFVSKTLHIAANFIAVILFILAAIFLFFLDIPSLGNFCLLTIFFLLGTPCLIEAAEDLLSLELNIDILMTLAAFAAAFVGSPFEGALLLVLFSISGALEEMVEAKARSSIKSLKKMSPTKAWVRRERGGWVEKNLRDIRVGDTVLVKAGETVGLDGVIEKGSALMNVAHLTGEAQPVSVKEGDSIPAGGMVIDSSLEVRVEHTSYDSTLEKMIQMVTEAQNARPQLQRTFERMSSYYAATIMSIAVLVGLTFPFLIGIPFLGEEGSIYRGLAFLIAASPCALILALPIAYLSAVSASARSGILIKGGYILDAIAQTNMIAFDKTGTLSTGELVVTEVLVKNRGIEKDLFLKIAKGLEVSSSHPIARAILNYRDADIAAVTMQDPKVVPGKGVEGAYEETPCFVGALSYIGEEHPEYAWVKEEGERLKKQGEIVAVVLYGQEVAVIGFRDEVRVGMKSLVERLISYLKMRVLMLTGDHEENAKRMAQEVGIQEYYADLLPEDKLAHIAELSDKKKLIMVGDGINDAPALARAHVGIAIGGMGSGAALDAADVVLLKDDLSLVETVILIARRSRKIVIQNLVIAAGALLLASALSLAGLIPLWIAVVMHEGGTVVVGSNALRLLKVK